MGPTWGGEVGEGEAGGALNLLCVLRDSDGSIDRPALGAIVFSDPARMRRLTGIVWPAVRQLVVEQREALGQAGVHICVAEAALMLEAGSDAEMDEVWVVFAAEGVVKQRLRERNGWSEEEAGKRIRSQVRFGNAGRHVGGNESQMGGRPLADEQCGESGHGRSVGVQWGESGGDGCSGGGGVGHAHRESSTQS